MSEPVVMLEFDEARRRLLGLAVPLGAERVDLRSANGRVLAEPVRSPVDLPSFDNSAMDGYAVCRGDLPAEPIGAALPVVGESRAGVVGPPLSKGCAQRIFTGAPLPDGADTVVIQENVERTGDTIVLRFPVTYGDHVRRVGEDVRIGDEVLAAGARLGPFQLSLLASMDWTTVKVSRRPRVSVLCTGDELRQPGMPVATAVRGMLPESNGVAIAALAESVGATVTLLPIGQDRLESLQPSIADALRASDVVVTVGGVSVGDYDVVNAAFTAAGVTTEFWKVRIRPGKPLSVGRWNDTLVLGLPGNPVSAQTTATLFLVPVLRQLQRDARAVPPFVRRTLAGSFSQSPGRRGFFRGVVNGDEVSLQSKQGSGSVVSMAHANALVTFDESSTGASAGDAVDTLLLADI